MPRLPPSRIPTLKITDQPWWQEKPFIYAWIICALILFDIAISCLTQNFHRLPFSLALYAAFLLPYLAYHILKRWRENRPSPEEPLPPILCPTCGYNLVASPTRCPECGNDTPRKLWLDAHPLEKAVVEKRLSPKIDPPSKVE